MPMRRVAELTAPPTTMLMIRMDMIRPRTPNATTNGANVAAVRSVACRTVR
jgi:hypothetical protein